MKVQALRTFKDLKGYKVRTQGEEFDITKKRFEEINSTSFGVLVKEIKKSKGDNKNEQSN